MSWFNTFAILVVAYGAVFFQASFNEPRQWLGAQVDLLPGLVVYASLSGGITTVALVATCSGLWVDSLSANPIGVSVLPLFLVGLAIQRSRELILREQGFAQMILGAAATATTTLLTLLLIINTHAQPLIGWFSVWQLIVVTAAGALITPVWFLCFDWIRQALNYHPLGESSFRADREIKRGR